MAQGRPQSLYSDPYLAEGLESRKGWHKPEREDREGKERGRQWEECTGDGSRLCVPTQTSAGGRTPVGPLKLRISLGLRRTVRPFDMCWDMKHRKITSKVHSQYAPYRHENAPEDLHGGWTHKSPASFIEQNPSHSRHTAPPKAPPTVTSSLQTCLSRTVEPLLYHHL